jgi:hypothetical protein
LTGFPANLLSAISIMNDGIDSYDKAAYWLMVFNIIFAFMQKTKDYYKKNLGIKV